MAHRVELIKDSSYVRLVLVGELTRADHDTARADAARSLVDNGCNKLLIDASLAEPKMSVGDDYAFTADHQSHLPIDLRTAIVHRPDEIERFLFIKTVGQNRGMDMRLFTDERKAVHWLLDK